MTERASGSADSASASGDTSLKRAFGLDRHPLTWGKCLLIGTAVVMVALGALLAWAPASSSPSSSAAKPDSNEGPAFPGSSFTQPAGGSGEGTSDSETSSSDEGGLNMRHLSPALIKGGFGMFVGFAIGFAIRAFVRLAVLIAGIYLLALTLMAYAGWVEIHWEVMETQFNQLASNLGEQFASFRQFLTGSIPATGMTGVGLFVGMKKK